MNNCLANIEKYQRNQPNPVALEKNIKSYNIRMFEFRFKIR